MAKASASKKKAVGNAVTKQRSAHKGIKAPIPSAVKPMLCTLTSEVENDPRYLYEIKWDGYRITSYTQNGKVRLDSRGGKDYTNKYPPVTQALKALEHDVVLDGEIVVFDEHGHPSFNAVQLYNGHNTPIFYYCFDILWLDGYALKQLPLIGRKTILRELISGNQVLRFSDSFDDGQGLYEEMKTRGFEGIVAKKKDSEYLEGDRSNNWLKVPTRIRQEFVIGGWAESDKARSFRSILFGAYFNGEFRWVGRSGGGYKEREMPDILKELKKREIKSSPFVNPVLDTKGAVIHWVRPELVANFEFAAWTETGRIRKPATWLGFRYDKKAKDVVLEVPKELKGKKPDNSEENPTEELAEEIDAEIIIPAKKKSARRNTPKRLATTEKSNWPFVEQQQQDDKTVFHFGDCEIELFSVDKELWKGITKADLIQYYHQVHRYLLPHIKDRPLSLHFKLQGPNAPGRYIKDMEGRQPDCAEIFTDERRHEAVGKRKFIDYLVCNNEATLLWMINWGCIDVNPWNARIVHPDNPDWIVIDLDPSEEKLSAKGLTKLRNTAMAVKEYCDSKKLKAFCKTSGKTGMHFLIPCSGFTTAEARALGEKICAGIHELVPNDSTITVNKSARDGKVFVDFSQNDYADTIAAPYSVRPFYIPLVSTPLEWKEINAKLDPRKFTMEEIIKRFDNIGDLFEKIQDTKIIAANNRVLRTI